MDCNERVSEWRHHQWRQLVAVSVDMGGGGCLFQINSPYNDALKDNLWGIKDRYIGSAPTAHTEPLKFPYLILFYSVFYLFTHFHLCFSLIVIWFATFILSPDLAATLSYYYVFFKRTLSVTLHLSFSLLYLSAATFLSPSSSFVSLSPHCPSLSICATVPAVWWARGW